MKRRLALSLVGLSLLACGAPSAEGAAPADASHDVAAKAPSGLAAKLLGRWTMAPPPSERRLVALARFALADPPDDAAFAKTSPTPEEQLHYKNVVRLKREEPGSRLLMALHQKLDELEGTSVTFTPKELITTTADGTGVKAYTVEKELDGELLILEDGDAPVETRRSIISFAGDDELVLARGRTRVPMVRAAPGSARKPTEAPSSPRIDVGARAPSGGAMAALDACEKRYFACTDSMPPEARSAMGPSLEMVKKLFRASRDGSTDPGSTVDACQNVVRMLASAGYCAGN